MVSKYIGKVIEAAAIAVFLTKIGKLHRLASCEWWFVLFFVLCFTILPAVVQWLVNPNTLKRVSIKLYQLRRRGELRRAAKDAKKYIKDVRNGKV